MKELTTRQSKLLILFYTCLNKIMFLPSVLSGQVQNNFWVVMALLFVLEGLFILLLLKINSLNPATTIFEKLQNVFGKFVSKAFFFLLGILLIFKLSIMFHEAYIYFFEALFVDLSWLIILVPLIIYLGYVATRNLRNFGRNIEIFYYVIIACIFIVLVDSFMNINFSNMLPLFNTSVTNISASAVNCCVWFGDFLALFFILGNVKMEKKTNKQIFSGWLLGVLTTLVVAVFFYSTFGSIASMKRLGLLDLTQNIPRLSSTGNFGWLISMLWPVAILFELGFVTFLIKQSYFNTFNCKGKYGVHLVYVCLTAVIVILTIFQFRVTTLMDFLFKGFKYYAFAVQYIIPAMLLIVLSIFLKQRGNNNAK